MQQQNRTDRIATRLISLCPSAVWNGLYWCSTAILVRAPKVAGSAATPAPLLIWPRSN